jgi:hypothetical protein
VGPTSNRIARSHETQPPQSAQTHIARNNTQLYAEPGPRDSPA